MVYSALMDIYKALGLAVAHFRSRRKITQEELAVRAKFSRTYISYLERGMRRAPLETIFLIAAALDITATELIAATARFKRNNTKH